MHTLERIFGKFTKPFRLYLRLSQNMKKVENYRISKESSASTHICRLPSRANRAYSSGLYIANASKAHWEQGVVRNPSSATLQSIRCITGRKGSILPDRVLPDGYSRWAGIVWDNKSPPQREGLKTSVMPSVCQTC